MLQDLRYAIRTMLRMKGWTAVVVTSLALSIGANTALFSVIDAKFLRKLPVERPDDLVAFAWTSKSWAPRSAGNVTSRSDDSTGDMVSTRSASFSYLVLEWLRTNAGTLSDVFAFDRPVQAAAIVDGRGDRVTVQLVSSNLFETLGLSAAAGRTMTPEDGRTAAEPVTVISHRLWQRRFAGEAAAIGKKILFRDTLFTIAGVTPPEFRGVLAYTDTAPDLFMPLEVSLRQNTSPLDTWNHLIMGRLKPGANLDQVRGNVEGGFQGVAGETEPHPRSVPGDMPRLEVFSGSRGHSDLGLDLGPDRPETASIFTTVFLSPVFGLLLLIVCLNVANLLLARAAAREHEIGVRFAIGASRPRLIRQLLTESVALAFAGGVLGVLFTYWGIDLLRLVLGPEIDLRVDWHILAFTASISLLTGILFGLAPAFQGTRTAVNVAARNNTRRISGSPFRYHRILLVAQVAISVVLLVGAGVFLRSVRNLSSADPGFDTANLLLFRIQTDSPRYSMPPQRVLLYDRIMDRINAIPGVVASTRSILPLTGGFRSNSLLSVRDSDAPPAFVRVVPVHSNFLDVMGVPLQRGQGLTSAVRAGPPSGVINETLARRLFRDSDPLGRRLKYSNPLDPTARDDIEIIGIVKDASVGSVLESAQAVVFVPELGNRSQTFEVRTAGDPMAVVPAIREAVSSIEPELPFFDIKTQTQQVEEGFATTRVLSVASSLFGSIALLLTCIGLYGLMSYGVTRRTREMGIRMALGARRVQVLALVMRQALFITFIGLILGLAGSLAINQLFRSFIFGVTPTDPVTIAAVTIVISLVIGLAAYLPARRASRVDPTVALRYE